jgi:hypothetical protein
MEIINKVSRITHNVTEVKIYDHFVTMKIKNGEKVVMPIAEYQNCEQVKR